jgi:branched-subunit amino acid ABC-type transport system permease component
MVYGLLTLINCAHGDIFMVSSYLALAGAAILPVEPNVNLALEVAHRA